MSRPENDIYPNPWEFAAKPVVPKSSYYVCISGNSGSGKSTLVRSIALAIRGRGGSTIAIDESSLHHPFLPHLFFEARSYALQIQLNFMIQRSLLVKHWLDKGFNLVMERSHIEDLVFIRHLRKEEYITEKEYDAYVRIWESIRDRIPVPDLMIFLNVGPDVSLRRLGEDERSGKRPREFPDEQTKERWIRSWHSLYVERMKEVGTDSNIRIKMAILDETYDMDEVISLVLEQLAHKTGRS